MFPKIKLYLSLIRFDKPIGTLLLFWPFLFSSLLTLDKFDYYLIIKFFFGSFFMRSAGCVINDIWDQDFDKKVQRTMNRPLASNEVTVIEAVIVTIICLFLGFLIALTFQTKTIIFGALSIPLIILYPLMKRITFFPQLFLGFTFNFGVLIAGMEIEGYLSNQVLLLYVACIFWTLTYDTIYGFMDIIDDKKIGVKSLSIFIEEKNPKIWLSCFYSLFFILLFFSINILNNLSAIILILSICFSIYQIIKLDLKNISDCMKFFKNSNFVAIFISLIIFLSNTKSDN